MGSGKKATQSGRPTTVVHDDDRIGACDELNYAKVKNPIKGKCRKY